MSNKKMTKREMFEQIKAKLTDEAEVAFIDHELELLAKKNSTERKPTAKQEENAVLKTVILGVLNGNGEPMTVTDVQKSCAELSELTNQRISALLRQMIVDGQVERSEVKGKAKFAAI